MSKKVYSRYERFIIDTVLSNSIDYVNEDRADAWKQAKETFGGTEATIKRFMNPVGMCEAFDRVSIIQHNWYDFVLAHPSIILNKQAYRLAYIVADLIGEIYQSIGGFQVWYTEKELQTKKEKLAREAMEKLYVDQAAAGHKNTCPFDFGVPAVIEAIDKFMELQT